MRSQLFNVFVANSTMARSQFHHVEMPSFWPSYVKNMLDWSDPVTKKTSVKGGSDDQGIEYAVSSMKGLRHTMEDRHIVLEYIPVQGEDDDILGDHSLFAVFDGHGGDFTADFCADNFLKVLRRQKDLKQYARMPREGPKSRNDVNGISFLKRAIYETFQELDSLICKEQQARNYDIQQGRVEPFEAVDDDSVREPQSYLGSMDPFSPDFIGERSGATGVVLILTPSHMVCANAGDSRAMLRRNGTEIPLSFDHKPSNLPEKYRITKAGGKVKGKRIDGDLAVSRAFGDFIYKGDPDLRYDQQKMSIAPDTLVFPRNLKADEFILLACDGIWDVASNSQCSEFVKTLLADGETNLTVICEEALDICLDRNSRDNMTFMLILLPGARIDRTRLGRVHNAVFGFRTTRRARKISNITTTYTCAAVECVTETTEDVTTACRGHEKAKASSE